ncbi:MAG: hypothetical protein JRI70_02535 [Deltaproteobacteria bacterium]|nr:hypothetical protein [Deltaproteobacteria bacterium]MBW2171469.1 hypothetical protein [Deltaproteobacteria bacterium]
MKAVDKLEKPKPAAKRKAKPKAKAKVRKKAPVKRVARKKAPAKKAPAKKGPVRKARVKKGPVKKTRAKKVPAKRTKGVTATDQVMRIIKRTKKGVDAPTLIKKTGFDERSVRNILYRVFNQKKIKRVGRGSYIAA